MFTAAAGVTTLSNSCCERERHRTYVLFMLIEGKVSDDSMLNRVQRKLLRNSVARIVLFCELGKQICGDAGLRVSTGILQWFHKHKPAWMAYVDRGASNCEV